MAYENLTFETSVAAALKAESMYADAGVLAQKDLITITPTGEQKTHIMAQIDLYDLKIFGDELDDSLRLQNPIIQSLYAKNAVLLANLIRVVNYNTRSGFKGSVGSGLQLDAVRFRAEQHQNPDAAGVAARTSWIRAIAAAASLQFICQPDALGANAHAALTLAANEGYALLGFCNTAASPCTSAFQPQYLGVNYNVQNLDFEEANVVYGDPIIELKQPMVIYPGENGLVSVRYYRNGNDELKPIGLWVKTAGNLRALATS